MTGGWIQNLREVIRQHIESRKYRISEHALSRQKQRDIKLPDVLEVLNNGFHEKSKSGFNAQFQTWNYAIRGKTIDGVELRIIVAFADEMIIITAIRLMKGAKI
ncbi:MAG: DUF4258 domain-containing protein [Chlamydiia bacterium]|nr:DUF4258 domain-containing protein [Chlamydiia bacterium]